MMKNFRLPASVTSPFMALLIRFFVVALLMALSLAMPNSALIGGEQQNSYTQLLDALASDSTAAQMSRLQNYILGQPDDERAYLKLLERYRDHKKSAEAEAFFKKQKEGDGSRRNRLWMRAKIAADDSLRSAEAESLFVAALQERSSTALLYDFTVFCHAKLPLYDKRGNYQRSEGDKLLRRYLSRTEDLALALGFYHYLDGKWEEAERLLKPASPSAQKDPRVLYVLSDCVLQNESLPLTKRYERANTFALHGRLLARQNFDREWQARFEGRLGDIAFQQDSIALAQKSYERAQDFAIAALDLYALQTAVAGLGKIQYMEGKYEAASARYHEAFEIAKRICAYREASLHKSNQCRVLTELGRFPQALQAGLISDSLANRAHDEQGFVRIRLNLGRVYCDLSQAEFAQSTVLKARDLAAQRGYFKLYQRANALLGDIGARGKKFEMARMYYKEYLTYLEYMNDQFERHSYFAKQADTYKDEGQEQYEKAIALYKEASRQAANAKSEYYQAWYQIEIADLETKLGRLEQARQTLQTILQEALRESEEGSIRYKLSWGQFLQKSGDLSRATAAYREAEMLINKARPPLNLDHLRIGYFSDRARAAQGLAECYFRRYQTSQALAARDSLFYYLEMTKGRSFHDLPTGKHDAAKLDSATQANYKSARQELEKLQRRLRLHPESFKSLRPQLEAARYSVIYNSPQFNAPQQTVALHHDLNGKTTASLFESLTGTTSESAVVARHDSAKACTFEEAQEFLRQQNAALLLYHIAEETAFVFAITPSEARALPLRTTRSQLIALRDSLMRPFNVEEFDGEAVARLKFQAGVAHELYELLVKPAVEAMNLPSLLVVVPEPSLSNLPFEMFLTDAPTQAVYTPLDSAVYAKDFLLHRFAFVYSPTFCMTKENVNESSPSRGVLVIANPDLRLRAVARNSNYRGRGWSAWEPLPYTEVEAQRIQEISSRTTLYTREQATEAAFLNEAAKYRVVHLASHAFVDSVYADFTGLVFALDSVSTNDGLLMGYEIADQKLMSELVTLSACQTGKGELVEGEGALGLPRLFLRAGAKSVIMTLWQVEDRFASELMPAFYEKYLNNGLTKVNALAEAKRAMLGNHKMTNGVYQQHPFYWAAFTLYGDPGQEETNWFTPSRVLMAGAAVLILFALFFYLRRRFNQARSNE